MKRYAWTAFFLVLALVGATQAVRQFRIFAQPPDATFSGPGSFKFKAPESATYTLWQEFRTTAVKISVGGLNLTAAQNSSAVLPPGTTVTVMRGAAVVPTKQIPEVTVSLNNDKRRSVLTFEGTQDAEYVVTVANLPETRKFLLSHNPLLEPLLWFLGWGAFALGAAVLGFVFLILALTGVFPKPPKTAGPSAAR